MSFGTMNTKILIRREAVVTDSEGFGTKAQVTVAEVRAYREQRYGSEKWANRAAFSEATDLFRFRFIPGVKITTSMNILCDDDVFDIFTVDNVRNKNMYLEVLARKRDPSGGDGNG